MFGTGKSNSSFLGGGESSSSGGGKSILPTFQDEPACAKFCPNLTYQQRIIGFVSCTGVGYLLSFLGTLVLIGGMSASNLRIFIILYVLGNIVSLLSTGFLSGPRAQCIKMWDPTRRFSTAFYLSMLVVVFAVAVTKQNIVLIFFLLFVEMAAGAWYSLSYIPYGRKIASAFLRRTGVCFPCFAAYDACHDARESLSQGSSSSSNKPGMFSSK